MNLSLGDTRSKCVARGAVVQLVRGIVDAAMERKGPNLAMDVV